MKLVSCQNPDEFRKSSTSQQTQQKSVRKVPILTKFKFIFNFLEFSKNHLCSKTSILFFVYIFDYKYFDFFFFNIFESSSTLILYLPQTLCLNVCFSLLFLSFKNNFNKAQILREKHFKTPKNLLKIFKNQDLISTQIPMCYCHRFQSE